MRSFQDKVCDVLTLAGLLGVTAFGTVSLWPEAKADSSEKPAPISEESESVQPDTLKELPLIEDKPVAGEKPADTLASDSISAMPASASDSASHSSANIMDIDDPDNTSVTTERKEKGGERDVQEKEQPQQGGLESLME